MSALDSFHPAVRTWFSRKFAAPTEAQERGWPEIVAGRDTLISAPTGSGKTLAAFLVSIDRLLRRAEKAPLDDAIEVLYISPLKALSNDIQRNLEEPLAEIAEVARELGYAPAAIRTMVRTGDTTSSQRQQIIRHPPHILITTPESFYLMLTAEKSRKVLRSVKTVIVDEIHALLRDKRGSHLSLSLARLDHICAERPSRIGLSATVKPIEDAARFLVGSARTGGAPDCSIVNAGHQRDLDLALDVPPTDLEAVCSGQQWADIYDRLAELIRAHRTTLIFVNTRRLAERVAHKIAERVGEEHVASHHGSLSKERRLGLERRLKAGELRALVATASLELGIDIGTVDLVCQIESPRTITTFLQRVGRSGHALGLVPKGRLFPTTRDELVECAALVRAVRSGRLDRVFPPVAPLDILTQQIVAECACEPWQEDDLYALVRNAAPYAELSRRDFDDVVELASEGVATGHGRAAAHLHRDRINRVLRGRRGARMTAIECGGAIPEVADYRVLAEPDGTFIGTLDEDFSIESMAGDIFLLGTTSWRIKRIEPGVVRVEDAHGAPPTIPFWVGEAPSRTVELSEEVGALRREVAARLDADGAAKGWLATECGLSAEAAEQIVRYIRAEKQALGIVPSDTDVVFERFFDESGGMQLVVHAPFGGRINRGWGLALRKNFCVNFDFELQAAASDDALLLSLGPQHSVPLEDLFSFVKADNVEEALTQALLAVPMFTTRWRWNATRALAVKRQRQGKRVPPPLQRMRSDDLLGALFPRLVACQENVTGPIDLPDHPLVRQTAHDCLTEAMDLEGLKAVLGRIERGEIRLHARETTEPSPFSHEMLNSKPYTFLDNAPLEERRARAITLRRTLPENARDLGALDASAIERVREEAWPEPRDPEELHDALLNLVVVRPDDAADWSPWFDALAAERRAAIVETVDGERLWFAAESQPLIRRLYPNARVLPEIHLPPELDAEVEEHDALAALVRGQMECLGPQTAAELARRTALTPGNAAIGLAQLEGDGVVLRGRFRAGAAGEEFCDRRLLSRIHRYTLDRLRREIEPVSAQDYLRFLLRWQHVAPGTQLVGKRGLLEAIAQLQGFELPAVAWERHILPARVAGYRPGWLDELCLSGDVAWARLSLRKAATEERPLPSAATSATPVALVRRGDLAWLSAGLRNGDTPVSPAKGAAHEVLAVLRERGALFYDDLADATRRLPADVEHGLWELVARGLVTADGFQALRSLMGHARRRSPRRNGRFASLSAGVAAGRWSLLPVANGDEMASEELAEAWAEQLLFRYGVVFRDAVQREGLTVPWRDVLRALRRMEARGVVRGGRFVAGFYGEQYARPEAVEALRRVRRAEKRDELVHLSAVDPLNLAGILTPGPRIPAIHTNVVAYRDGLPALTETLAPAGGG
ncbi:MAG: DEAD/DEAH box helicase [Chloroflexi bacterium]|nr:DEAD/DEAH box helicase [Chloroflexota bacterium]